ncbi:MAG: hypothetical protein UT33_C0012G0017 [Candidatus Peregrinibacteria bacterium GW2011_GWC2_39_14]|nr:MAG: hypothetical protein US92_C0003G0044 [Candidatus Peregrinibacteria bacterium GW2011_GWA2_38_36]KKR05212.1 MAG: hypothetical protein UT33_C0012G0017 [Candidatus Peregrinibacteria bacterium GW2011_GWC2_39_14]
MNRSNAKNSGQDSLKTVNEFMLVRAFGLKPELEVKVVFKGRGVPREGIVCDLVYRDGVFSINVPGLGYSRTVRLNGSAAWADVEILGSEEAIAQAVVDADDVEKARGIMEAPDFWGDAPNGPNTRERVRKTLSPDQAFFDEFTRNIFPVLDPATPTINRGYVITECHRMDRKFGRDWIAYLSRVTPFDGKLRDESWTGLRITDQIAEQMWGLFKQKFSIVGGLNKRVHVDFAASPSRNMLIIQFKFI